MARMLKADSVSPFDTWSDWHGDGAVVTFLTMSHHLWNRYSNNVIKYVHIDHEHENVMDRANCEEKQRTVIPELFTVDDIDDPGITKDGEDSYTIIVPQDFLSPKLCERWIQKLNDEYGEDFHLSYTDVQTQDGRMQTFFSTNDTCPGCDKAMVEGRTKALSGGMSLHSGDEFSPDGIECDDIDMRITDAIGYCRGCGKHLDVDIIIEDGVFTGLDI